MVLEAMCMCSDVVMCVVRVVLEAMRMCSDVVMRVLV